MSAIFGFLRHDGSAAQEEHLRFMAEPILERGPDGHSFFAEGPVGLGFVRLQTCPELEPVTVEAGQSPVVVSAARLDNRDQLLPALDLPQTTCDTVVLQHAQRKWKETTPEHLQGDFAYASWDRQNQTLTIVRDQIGVRPIYLAMNSRFTAFASDPRSLLALPEVSDEQDDSGVFQFFFPSLGALDQESTWYASIKRLPAANILELSPRGEKSRRRYWSLDRDRQLPVASNEEYIAAFKEVFTKAVQRRLRSSGDIGSTLSGGLDSSSIAAVAAKLLEKEGRPAIHTFSAWFPATPVADESQYSQAVFDNSRVIPHKVFPGENSPLAVLPEIVQGLAYPIFFPNIFLPFGVCSAARDRGIRVMMDGTDGDSTVGHGIDLFVKTTEQHNWSQFAHEAGAVTDRFDNNRYATKSGFVSGYAIKELNKLARRGNFWEVTKAIQLLGKKLGMSRKDLLLRIVKGVSTDGFLMPDLSHLDPHFVARADGPRLLGELYDYANQRPFGRKFNHFRGFESGILPGALEMMDCIGASCQVEYRFPFCDLDLIEFCMAMPVEVQLHNGWSRWILCKAMDDILPAKVCWRGDKSMLSSVLDHGLQRYEMDYLQNLTENPSPFVQEFFQKKALSNFYANFSQTHSNDTVLQLWRAAILEYWVKRNKY